MLKLHLLYFYMIVMTTLFAVACGQANSIGNLNRYDLDTEAAIPDTFWVDINDSIPDTITYDLRKKSILIRAKEIAPEKDYYVFCNIRNELSDSIWIKKIWIPDDASCFFDGKDRHVCKDIVLSKGEEYLIQYKLSYKLKRGVVMKNIYLFIADIANNKYYYKHIDMAVDIKK